MLKKRVITACFLLPSVVLAVIFLPSPSFAIISGLIFLLAIWEWTYLAGFESKISRTLCLLLFPLVILLLITILQWLGREVLEEGLFLLLVAFWLFALYSLYHYPKSLLFSESRVIGVISGCLVLVPAWVLLVALQYSEPKLVLYILALIWMADITAFFVGKRFGRHKLAPSISPGKTWEGVLGALSVSFLIIGLGYSILQPGMSILSWVILGIISVVFSIVGDLFESSYKRIRNIKDSGTLLPGHGGMLDRIDSLTAAIPMFTIGFMFFNRP